MVDDVVRAPLYGMTGRLWKRIEPDRSQMMTTSRGRCMATAVAVTLKLLMPKIRPNASSPW